MITASIAPTSGAMRRVDRIPPARQGAGRTYLSIWLCPTIGKKAGIAYPAKVSVLHGSFTHEAMIVIKSASQLFAVLNRAGVGAKL